LEVSSLNEYIPGSADQELGIDLYLTIFDSLADSVEIHETPYM